MAFLLTIYEYVFPYIFLVNTLLGQWSIMSDDTEVEIKNHEEVIMAIFIIIRHNQLLIKTPTVGGSQQPTPNRNSYDGSARSTPRLVHTSSAVNLRDQRPESVTLV